MQLTSVLAAFLAGGVVGVHALQSNTATGFACLNGFYGADMAGAASSLTSVTYMPLGTCVPTSQYPGVGGVIFSADATNKLYASYFATSSCGAQATQLTLAQLTTAGIVTSTSTTVATTTAGVSDVQCDTAALTAVGISAVGTPSGLAATGPLAPLVGQVSPDGVPMPSPTCGSSPRTAILLSSVSIVLSRRRRLLRDRPHVARREPGLHVSARNTVASRLVSYTSLTPQYPFVCPAQVLVGLRGDPVRHLPLRHEPAR